MSPNRTPISVVLARVWNDHRALLLTPAVVLLLVAAVAFGRSTAAGPRSTAVEAAALPEPAAVVIPALPSPTISAPPVATRKPTPVSTTSTTPRVRAPQRVVATVAPAPAPTQVVQPTPTLVRSDDAACDASAAPLKLVLGVVDNVLAHYPSDESDRQALLRASRDFNRAASLAASPKLAGYLRATAAGAVTYSADIQLDSSGVMLDSMQSVTQFCTIQGYQSDLG